MRNEALYRQWQILHSLYNSRINGISKTELADLYQVSKKTIERDITNLSTAGFPIFDDLDKARSNQRFYYMDRNYTIPEILLSDLENYAMYILMKVSSPIMGYFDLPLKDSFNKIFAQANPEFREFALKFSDLIIPDTSCLINLENDMHQNFATILEAIFKNRKLSFKYKSIYSNAIKEHIVSPLSVKYYKNNFYLAAYLKRKHQVLVFAINRVYDLEILAESQDRVKFNPAKFFEDSFGITQGKQFQVKLLFKKEVSQYISERVWHINQTLNKQASGELILEIPAKSMMEMVSFVLSYQDKVTVLEPHELRDEVVKALERMVGMYQLKGTQC